VDVVYDEQKFTELVLYVAEQLRDDKAGGATKLGKVLYFAEFAHVRRAGIPIAGTPYQRRAPGPVPKPLDAVQKALVARGDGEIVHETFLGYEQQRFVPLRAADRTNLSDAELQTVDSVLADLRTLTAKQITDLSRAEPGWVLVDDGQSIPYETAFLSPEHVAPTMMPRATRDVATPNEARPIEKGPVEKGVEIGVDA
jgi:hypothetical protein